MTGARLPKRDLMAYGALALPAAFAGLPLYIHAPDYYATEFGLSLGLLGVALLGLRLFDAVQDPVIGALSDRFAARRLWIVVGAGLILVLGFAALFQPMGPPFLWFILAVLLATTAHSVLSISINADGAVWSRDANEKTRIAAFREAFGLIGLTLAVIAPGILTETMPARTAFGWVAAMLAVLMIAALIPFIRWRRSTPIGTAPAEGAAPFWRVLARAELETRRFFTIYAISMLASAIPAILVIFFIRDRLDAEAYTGLFLLLYFLAGAAGTALWRAVSERIGKGRAWAAAMALAIVSFIWAGLLGPGDIAAYATICVLSGVAFGADLVLPPSLLADRLQAEGREDRAAAHFGVLAFLAKAALALGSALAFPALDLAGFEPAAENGPGALIALSAVYAFIPCAIKAAALILLWRALSGETHAQADYHPAAGDRRIGRG